MIWIILVNMQNLKLLAFLLSVIRRHKDPFSRSHRDWIFTPWNQSKFGKNHFLSLIFYGPKLYPLCISLIFKQNKKFTCSIFKTSHLTNNCNNPPGESIFPEFFQNVSNRYKVKVTEFGCARLSSFRAIVNNLMVRAKKPPAGNAIRLSFTHLRNFCGGRSASLNTDLNSW